jgi:hypothetical protein
VRADRAKDPELRRRYIASRAHDRRLRGFRWFLLSVARLSSRARTVRAFVIQLESIPANRPVVESSAVDSEGGEAKFVCMASPVLRRTTHLQHNVWGVKGTYVQACDALRALRINTGVSLPRGNFPR